MKPKLIRVTTVPISMNILLRNQLAFISQHFEVFGVSSNDDKHFPEITQREGVSMVAIEMTRNISPIKDLKALVKMIGLFLKEKPAIVHSHTPKAGLLSMVAAKITGVTVRLHTLAGMPLMEAKGLRKWLLCFSERITYACATAIFPNSRGLKQFVLEKKLARNEKLKIIGNGSSNGVDLAFFSKNAWEDPVSIRETQRAQWGIDQDDFVFCFVGRLVKDKGLKELVEAFLEIEKSLTIKASGRKVKLLFIGPWGSGRDEPDAWTRVQIKNHPDIIHAGRHDDIRPFLLAGDVFVFPSYREGFPNAVLQAGAMELPCIVSDINGCNEIIVHGENGLIVPPKNSTQLFEAMSILLNDENLRTKLAANARQMIASRYDQKAFWAELLKTYQELLEKANLVNEKP